MKVDIYVSYKAIAFSFIIDEPEDVVFCIHNFAWDTKEKAATVTKPFLSIK